MNLLDLVATIRVNLDEFDRGLGEAQRRFNNFSSGLKDVGYGLKDIADPAVKGFQAVEGVGNKAADIVKKGLGGFAVASTAVAGFGTAAVKSGMAFDATMSEVSAISGATGDEFQSLRDKALEMGAKTKFSASEAASAMTYMGMAGWKAGDMIGGIEGIMNLAAASGEDLATTSDIVTDALTAFGMQASDSGHFANVMAVASSNANTNVGMMGETFKYVAPVAGALGYSVDDTALAIGLMANSGIKASNAGTALRAIMSRLSTDAGASSKKLGALGVLTQKLGVEFYNADGSARGLNEVLTDSRAAWAGLSEEQQITYAKTIAGQEAMSGWLALMNAAPADIDKLTESLARADEGIGAAGEMAATMVDNLQGDLTLLGSAFESLQIAISDALTPTLREFAQFGQKAMANLLEGFQGGGTLGFMSALQGIVAEGIALLSEKAPDFANVAFMFVETLANGILDSKDNIISAAKEIISMLSDGCYEWLAVNGEDMVDFGRDIVTTIFDGFSEAGNVISEHIGKFIPLIAEAFLSYHETLFTVGIDILGAIGQGIIDNKDGLQEMASETIRNMVTALRENAPAIIEGGIALIEALAGAIMENMPLILETGAEIVGQLVAGISTSLPALAVAIGPILLHIGTIIDTIGKIKDVVKTVVEFVAGGSGIGKIIEIGKKLMSGIQALWALILAHPVAAAVAAIIAAIVLLWTHCEEFRNFFIGLWEKLKEAVSAFGDWISAKMGEIVQWIKEKWEGIAEFFSGIWEGIKNVFAGVAEFFGAIFAAAVEAVKAAWNGVTEFFAAIWDGIKTIFSVVAEVLGSFFSAAWEAIKTVWSVAAEFFSGVWEAIQEIFSVVEEVLGGFFKAAWEAIKTVWDAAVDFFTTICDGIQSVFEAVTEFLENAFTEAWEAIKAIWEKAKGFFQDVWDAIKGAAEKTATAIGDAFKKAWDAVKSAWDKAESFFRGIVDKIVGVFKNIGSQFLSIGKNIVEGIKNGISNAWSSFIGWLSSKITGIVDAVKGMLGIHSPSKVFAGIGENMALGLAEGWDDEYRGIKRQIENGLDFGAANIGLNASHSGTANYDAYGGPERTGNGLGGTTVNIYSPVAVDAVQAAREWKKTSQQIAMGLV